MKQTSLKSIARHMVAVQSGKVDKTNIIGIRKAINAIEQGDGWSFEIVDAVFELECAIAERRPVVTGALHESGLKVLRNPRYAKRWNEREAGIISRLHHFELIRFDRVGMRGRVVGQNFAFRNIPWHGDRSNLLGEIEEQLAQEGYSDCDPDDAIRNIFEKLNSMESTLEELQAIVDAQPNGKLTYDL